MSRNPIYIKLINTTKWRNLRAKKLSAQPLCSICDDKGIATPATEVHHITPVESVHSPKAMETLMYDYDNLLSVCRQCHREIHKSMLSNSKENIIENKKRQTNRFIDKYLK